MQQQREGQVNMATQHQIGPGSGPCSGGIRMATQQVVAFASFRHRCWLVHHNDAKLLGARRSQHCSDPRNL